MNQRLRYIRYTDDDIGSADGVFQRQRRCSHLVRERLGVGGSTAPDADFADLANNTKCLKMCAGLHSRAEYGEGQGLVRSEEAGGDGRHGGGAHFGDEAAVESGERLSGCRAEKLDDGLVRWQGRVVFEDGDELDAHEVGANGGHDSEEAVVPGRGKDAADGLRDFACRKADESALKGRDERFVSEMAADLGFIENEHADQS